MRDMQFQTFDLLSKAQVGTSQVGTKLGKMQASDPQALGSASVALGLATPMSGSDDIFASMVQSLATEDLSGGQTTTEEGTQSFPIEPFGAVNLTIEQDIPAHDPTREPGEMFGTATSPDFDPPSGEEDTLIADVPQSGILPVFAPLHSEQDAQPHKTPGISAAPRMTDDIATMAATSEIVASNPTAQTADFVDVTTVGLTSESPKAPSLNSLPLGDEMQTSSQPFPVRMTDPLTLPQGGQDNAPVPAAPRTEIGLAQVSATQSDAPLFTEEKISKGPVAQAANTELADASPPSEEVADHPTTSSPQAHVSQADGGEIKLAVSTGIAQPIASRDAPLARRLVDMTGTSATPEQAPKAHQPHSPAPPADTVSSTHMVKAEAVMSSDVTSRPNETSKGAGNAPTVDTAEPVAATKTEVGSAHLPIMGSAASMMPEEGDDWRHLSEDLPGIPPLTSEHTAPRDAASPSMPTRLEWSPRLAAQIAEAARQIPDRPVEITLSPEELGKVRLSFHLSENGAMQVVIAAERTDTLDLLRRNVESLSTEFRDLGYSDSGFTFQNFDQGTGQQATAFDEVQSSADLPSDMINTIPLQTPVRLSLGSSSGMDLRL